jgi:hypothetical protein
MHFELRWWPPARRANTEDVPTAQHRDGEPRHQQCASTEPSFANHAFDFLVMDLAAENEVFVWS